jgi:thiamine-monophosphate kinase
MSTGEDDLVTWLRAHTDIPRGLCPIGIGDDMAQVRWAEDSLCITTDMLLEGVHFDLAEASLTQVGYKAMAVSLSDCAAMATHPVAAVVSLGLPSTYEPVHVQQIHTGLQEAGRAFDCALVGGDTTRWPRPGHLVVNIAMLSRPAAGRHPVPRSGAQVGDVIVVTGSLGGSGLGHHLTFTPRVREALLITEYVDVHAMMDLSDGLSTDLRRLCRASEVGAVIRAMDLPLSSQAQSKSDPRDAALNEGEDFELLFTLSPAHFGVLKSRWQEPVPLTAIGAIETGSWIAVENPDGSLSPLVPGGYDHFAPGSEEKGG